MGSRRHTVEALKWRDPPAGEIVLPKGMLRMTWSAGSGLASGVSGLWGLGDRGPNLKVDLAVGRYGVEKLAHLRDVPGAKIMPSPLVGPELTELFLDPDRVREGRRLRLTTPSGRPVSGLPLPGGDAAEMEPAYDLTGQRLGSDPDGADTEGLAIAPDGGFWVADEYGPSLLRVDSTGVVTARFVPQGLELPGAEIPVHPTLPAIAARRRTNRGFEAIAVSPDGGRLFIAFQSALDGEDQHLARIWTFDTASRTVIAEHLYPFDAPKAFQRDREAGKVGPRDLKICDAAAIGENQLLILERISRSAKIYRVTLTPGGLLAKTLILDTDDDPDIAADLEGLALVTPDTLILATDNDFGVEGAETRFFRVKFQAPISAD